MSAGSLDKVEPDADEGCAVEDLSVGSSRVSNDSGLRNLADESEEAFYNGTFRLASTCPLSSVVFEKGQLVQIASMSP